MCQATKPNKTDAVSLLRQLTVQRKDVEAQCTKYKYHVWGIRNSDGGPKSDTGEENLQPTQPNSLPPDWVKVLKEEEK